MFLHNSHSTELPQQTQPSWLFCKLVSNIRNELNSLLSRYKPSSCSPSFLFCYVLYRENLISFPLLLSMLLSGPEQAERDPCCRQGYWHKDRGWVGGLHGRDWHFGLLQPSSHCQTAGCLLFWGQTLGKWDSVKLIELFLLFFSWRHTHPLQASIRYAYSQRSLVLLC